MDNLFLNIDCMDKEKGMPSYPDKYFDLAIVDPPYGIDYADKKIKGATVKDRNGWQIYEQKKWDREIPHKEYFDELLRVSKNQIIWGGNYFTEFLSSSRCWVIWYKVPYEFTLSQAELAWTSFNSRVLVYERMTNEDRGFLGVNIHPTQKPVALYKWLLTKYAKPNDKILDTHVGSGSSRIACWDMGFDFTGYEIDEDYYCASEKRFQQYIKQEVLFPPQKYGYL